MNTKIEAPNTLGEKKARIEVKIFMINEAPVSPSRKFSLKQASMRKRLGLSFFLVVVIIIVIVLSHFFISIFVYESEVEITSSSLQIHTEDSSDYTQIFVDVTLFNPGHPRGTTLWVEITDKSTNVSFSKTQYVQIDFRELETLTFVFTVDKLIYLGEFSHKTWLTYPNSQD